MMPDLRHGWTEGGFHPPSTCNIGMSLGQSRGRLCATTSVVHRSRAPSLWLPRCRQSGPMDLSPAIRATLVRHLAVTKGILTTAQARDLGIDGDLLARCVRRKVLLRVGRGAYVDGALFASADRDGRTLLRIRAIAATWPPGIALADVSAAFVWGLPLLKPHGARVHGFRPGQSFRKTQHYTLHGGCPPARTTVHEGLPVLEPAYVILAIATYRGLVDAVAAGDAALHGGLVSIERLREVALECGHHAGAATFRAAIDLMDEACESPGESRTRLLVRQLGFDVDSQVTLRDSQGFVGRVDFMVKGHKVVIEFDGLVKYDGHDGKRALAAEKQREDRLRRLGYAVVRLTWRDLDNVSFVRRVIETAIRQVAA